MLGIQACSTTAVSPDQQPTQATVESRDKPGTKTPAIDPAANSTYLQALRTIEQGNEGQAIKLLSDMSRQYPALSGPQTNLGLIYYNQDDIVKAEAAFKAALGINPKNAVAHNHLGIIYRRQGRFREAETAYLSAIQHKPDYANAHLNLGILYDIYLLKLDKALQHYQKFQSLQASEDKTVKNWIIGLKRRLKVS